MAKLKNQSKIDHLRYPIGKFTIPKVVSHSQLSDWLNTLDRTPFLYREVALLLSETDLDLRYREGSWNVRQLFHHVADSHTNGLTRIKWALTEESPTIKPYDEVKWAQLPDATDLSIEHSLDLLAGTHVRWTYLIRSLSEMELSRTFKHPDTNSWISVAAQCGLYAWHGLHHLEHVKLAVNNRPKR